MRNQATSRELIILENNLAELQEFAWQAIFYQNLMVNQFVLFTIEVNSRWSNLADFLIANHNLQANLLEEIAINGFATPALLEMVSNSMPHLRNKIFAQPSVGHARLLLLTDDGVSILEIEPRSNLQFLH
jgi:hypothetical protein